MLKNFGNIAIVHNNLPKVRIWTKRDIQKIGKLIIKALAAFAEDCLSLRIKRVPQELQVPAYLLLLPFIFCWSETFLVRSLVTKNEHE